MDIIKNISSWIRGLTEIGLSVLMLGVVFQIIFGANVVFLPIDILGNVISCLLYTSPSPRDRG